MFTKLNKLTHRGDTIVEVMIALAVLGLAISLSYATANRSLQNTRQAEENAQAARYVQTEIESLRSLAPSGAAPGGPDHPYDDPNNIFSQSTSFCVPDTTHNPPIQSGAACLVDNLYQIAVYNCNLATSAKVCEDIKNDSDTFVVEISWPDVNGRDTDGVTQAYRVHSQS